MFLNFIRECKNKEAGVGGKGLGQGGQSQYKVAFLNLSALGINFLDVSRPSSEGFIMTAFQITGRIIHGFMCPIGYMFLPHLFLIWASAIVERIPWYF